MRRAVVVVDRAKIIVRAHVAFEVLRPVGRPVWVGSKSVRGWMLDRNRRGYDRVPDVLAVLEHAGFHVRVEERDNALDGGAA